MYLDCVNRFKKCDLRIVILGSEIVKISTITLRFEIAHYRLYLPYFQVI